MTGTVSMTNAGRIASSVAAARPSTVDALICAPKTHADEYPTMPRHEWLNGFGFSRQGKQVLREAAIT